MCCCNKSISIPTASCAIHISLTHVGAQAFQEVEGSEPPVASVDITCYVTYVGLPAEITVPADTSRLSPQIHIHVYFVM